MCPAQARARSPNICPGLPARKYVYIIVLDSGQTCLDRARARRKYLPSSPRRTSVEILVCDSRQTCPVLMCDRRKYVPSSPCGFMLKSSAGLGTDMVGPRARAHARECVLAEIMSRASRVNFCRNHRAGLGIYISGPCVRAHRKYVSASPRGIM